MIKIIPYIEANGHWTWRDTEVLAMFDRMKNEGMADTVFYDEEINRVSFLRRMKYGPCHMYVAMMDKAVAGFAWLSNIEGRSAWLNFYVFKNYWCGPAEMIARECLRHILHIPAAEGGYCFDVLMGITPVRNKAASEFICRAGCKVVGRVPQAAWLLKEGKSVPGFMVYCTRDELQDMGDGNESL